MSYPDGVATGNAVIAAALAWDDLAYHLDGDSVTEEDVDRWLLASHQLRAKVAAHRAATAHEHTQGPDIDVDEKP
jgi:hypothetical protein